MVKKGLIIKKQVGYKNLHGSDVVYCLTKKGQNVVSMMLEIEDVDIRRSSYSFKEIQVKGSIKRHIYLQEWVSLLQHKFININERYPDYVYRWVEHCQPNRNPILNNGSEINYTPDWLIFYPNDEINYIEHLVSEAGTILYHHQIREELYFHTDYKKWVMLECDLESEDYSRLKRKLVNLKKNIDLASDILVIFTAIDVKLPRSETTSYDKGNNRLRNVRQIVLKLMEHALTGDVIQIVQGELRQTLDTCNKIFWESRTCLFEAEPINWGYLLKDLLYSANEGQHLNETTNMDEALYKPFFDEFLLFKKEGQQDFDVQFITNTRTGLLNPIAKMNKLQENMMNCNHIKKKYVFVYPNRKRNERRYCGCRKR
jgi:CRISPR/Cas system-associated endoribonuclease Cas2